MTIIIIIACCWILYRCGKMSGFLELFRLTSKPHQEPTKEPHQEPPHEPPHERTPERLKIEAIAMNILLYKGIETAPTRVKRLSNSELNNIIDTFKSELNI